MPPFKHGVGAFGKRTQAYQAWTAMRGRCNNPNSQDYSHYGGKGIKVSPAWDEFLDFLRDMGEPPSPKHTLDRIKRKGNYEPGNCRWATRAIQAQNRDYCSLTFDDANAIRARYSSTGITQKDLASEYGVSQTMISQIIRGNAWADLSYSPTVHTLPFLPEGYFSSGDVAKILNRTPGSVKETLDRFLECGVFTVDKFKIGRARQFGYKFTQGESSSHLAALFILEQPAVSAKLTRPEVAELRRLRSVEGLTQYELADRFGIKQSTVSVILAGRTWR